MAELIFKALIVLGSCSVVFLTATLVVSALSAICKAADELERIADALEERQGDDEEGEAK